MIKEKKLRDYIEPEMKIKRINFSDIMTASSPEKEQGNVTTDIPKVNDPWNLP